MPSSMPSLLPRSFSRWGVGAVGGALVVAHNLFDHSARPEAFGAWGPVFAVYPLMPWIGLIAVGYAVGRRRGMRPRGRDLAAEVRRDGATTTERTRPRARERPRW